MDTGSISSSVSIGGTIGFVARYWDANATVVVSQVNQLRGSIVSHPSWEDKQRWFMFLVNIVIIKLFTRISAGQTTT
jgi:hypothetical protein